MDGGAWQTTVQGITKSQTVSMHTHHLTPGPITWVRVPEISAAVNKFSCMKLHVNYTQLHSEMPHGSTPSQRLEVQSNS